ncbi:MAG: Adenylosuccinate synthetase [candidate division WS2 bacterium]|nr:Adenylosuccinate synthetase [Candidatus Lithacetigena glycinireducens]
MPVVIVVGAQWGDEGKGKIIDFLTEKANLVARYQGGPNAGHTVYIGKEKYVLHLIPSGILHKGVKCVIGSGVVVDPAVLLSEITTLRSRGIEVDDNLIISANAHLIMPYHLIIDKAVESIKKNKKIGTTGKGIGPAYEDKIARYGIRVGDILQPKLFEEKLYENLFTTNFLLENYFHLSTLSARQIYDDYINYGHLLERYISDTEMVVNQAIDKNWNLLFEGAQGTFLDVDHGTYPYVTSSNTVAGGACTGLGVGPTKINRVLGVSKAYTTRVGSGPFPTELKDDFGDYLRSKGKEFGATTADLEGVAG